MTRKGFILPAALALTVFMLLIAGFLLSFVTAEQRIAVSQAESVKTYYLAEAGAKEAIWLLENDPTMSAEFVSNPTWSTEFTRTDPLFPNGSYHVAITNNGIARGEIVATGTVTLPGGTTSQRIVRSTIFKATGELSIGDSAIATGSNKIDFTASRVNVDPGSIFSNNNILVQTFSDVDVQNEASATNNITIQAGSSLTAGGGLHDAGTYAPPPASIAMPAVDFDSADADSYLNRAAGNVYTESQFESMLWNDPNLVLNGITYVTGRVRIRGNTHLTVNGALVADSSIEIGKTLCWFRPGYGSRCGNSSITVNRTPGQPAGILTKAKIDIDPFTNNIAISGLLYALDDIKFTNLGGTFSITGGLIGQKLTTVSAWNTITMAFDETTIAEAVGESLFSPVVTIEHWEEEY